MKRQRSEVSILDIPQEVIIIIMLYMHDDIKSLVNLVITCKRFNVVAKNEAFLLELRELIGEQSKINPISRLSYWFDGGGYRIVIASLNRSSNDTAIALVGTLDGLYDGSIVAITKWTLDGNPFELIENPPIRHAWNDFTIAGDISNVKRLPFRSQSGKFGPSRLLPVKKDKDELLMIDGDSLTFIDTTVIQWFIGLPSTS